MNYIKTNLLATILKTRKTATVRYATRMLNLEAGNSSDFGRPLVVDIIAMTNVKI